MLDGESPSPKAGHNFCDKCKRIVEAPVRIECDDSVMTFGSCERVELQQNCKEFFTSIRAGCPLCFAIFIAIIEKESTSEAAEGSEEGGNGPEFRWSKRTFMDPESRTKNLLSLYCKQSYYQTHQTLIVNYGARGVVYLPAFPINFPSTGKQSR